MGRRNAMAERLLLTAMFAALAALLLQPEQAAVMMEPARQALAWAAQSWPALREADAESLLTVLRQVLAIGLLLLIPVIWLKPT